MDSQEGKFAELIKWKYTLVLAVNQKYSAGYDKGVDRNPALSFDHIDGLSLKGFDLEMLLDPLEEDLYFPSVYIQDDNLLCFS